VLGLERLARGLALAAGSIALLAAMAADFIGVVGRHLGFTLLGGTEFVQVCVVVAISSALIVATLRGAHASVHILTERLPATVARRLGRVSDLFGALLFALLTAGSFWMLWDTWGLDERTDILGLPLAPARILWTGALAATATVFLIRAFGPHPLPAAEPHGDRADGR
jgi:TRAP-type C4-dicarboxylate transport system permease small subunit